MLQVLVGLAAVDNTVLAAINFEQEKHVVLIDFAAVVALHQLVNRALDDDHFVEEAGVGGIHSIACSFTLDLCIDPLLLHQVALQQSVVQFDLCKALKIIETSTSKLCQNTLQKVSHQVMMIDKDL